MSPVAGPFFALTLLLGAAGALKMTRPDATRVALRNAGLPGTISAARGLGVVEVAIAATALWAGGRVPALAVGAAYLGFAGFSELLRRRTAGRAGCGCFGAGSAPVTRLHVGVNLVAAAAAVATAVVAANEPLAGFGPTVADTPGAGLPFFAGTVVLVWLLKALLTDLPELQAAIRPRPGTDPTGGAAR